MRTIEQKYQEAELIVKETQAMRQLQKNYFKAVFEKDELKNQPSTIFQDLAKDLTNPIIEEYSAEVFPEILLNIRNVFYSHISDLIENNYKECEIAKEQAKKCENQIDRYQELLKSLNGFKS